MVISSTMRLAKPLFMLLCLSTSLLPNTVMADLTTYGPVCSDYADPPPGGWKRWSDPSSWPNGVVPGINSATGINVNVPCNVGILLDISITVDRLQVDGWLKVVDVGPIYVSANFVIVQGKLTIGTVEEPYTGKVIFTLTSSGYNYTWTRAEGTPKIGTKAFAVVGGQVEFNGMYQNQKPWSILSQNADKGATSISVSDDVSAWPVGARIAIASTDYDYRQAESRTITFVKFVDGKTVIGLNYPLFYTHWGDSIPTGVDGQWLNEAAEVALLDRTIVIRGSRDADPLIGGHFMVFETQTQQKIVGIELINMGQQGRVGRYPMHFHMCRSVKGSFVRKISVHSSNQRCVVIHGTFDLVVERNVAYYTKGHCFILEDGAESGNVFYKNLGFFTEAVARLIVTTETNAIQSDDVPATFWISNPNNTWVGNVAAGSQDSGFWFQLETTVLGPSAKLPEAQGVYPKFVPLLTFDGNVGHSNQRSGMRTFKPGMKPREFGGRFSNSGPQNAKPVTVYVRKFRGYKNAANGLLFRRTDSVVVQDCVLADNRVAGIEFHDAQNITVHDSIFLGETENVGNAAQCDQPGNYFGSCEPLPGYGCNLPVDPANARSLGSGQSPRVVPHYGILIDQMEYVNEGYTQYPNSLATPYPIHLYNLVFGKFSNRCKTSAAIAGDGFRHYQIFSAGHRSSGLRFLDGSPRFYIAPQSHGLQGNYNFTDAGSTVRSSVFRDLDGTLVGGQGGYIVANNKALLPLNPSACTGIEGGSYAWACPGTCYRTVAFSAANYLSPIINVTRAADNTAFSIQGYVTTFINLLSNSPYNIRFTPSPAWVQIWYADPYGCTSPVNINLKLPNGYRWTVANINQGACRGNLPASDPSCNFVPTIVCGNGNEPSRLNLVLGGNVWSKMTLNLEQGNYPGC